MEKGLSKKPIVFLLLLILVDLICTIVWAEAYGVSEWNPILSPFIEISPISFALVKLILSVPSIFVLSRFREKLLSKIGILTLCLAYTAVTGIHIYVAFKL
jgi:hypothetical protein